MSTIIVHCILNQTKKHIFSVGTYAERYMDLNTPEDNEAVYNVSY